MTVQPSTLGHSTSEIGTGTGTGTELLQRSRSCNAFDAWPFMGSTLDSLPGTKDSLPSTKDSGMRLRSVKDRSTCDWDVCGMKLLIAIPASSNSKAPIIFTKKLTYLYEISAQFYIILHYMIFLCLI